jgi:CDGSH iron-sulfur domain-containing protein 3
MEEIEELEVKKKDYATIQLKPRGPITITGNFEIILEDGTIMEKREKVSLCRCGMSLTMPICDGAHKALASLL